MNRVLATILPVICLACILSGTSPAQIADLEAAGRELHGMFDRTPGTPISEEQKQRLAEFLKRYAGQDLGPLGYARALDAYFRRDAQGGAAALDEFFAKNDRIAHTEHATMAGRIYLLVMREESQRRNADALKLQLWAERTAAMFPDLPTVARVATSVVPRLADGAAFRVALVRGLQRSNGSDADKDQFLAMLYATGPGSQSVTTTPAMDVVAPTTLMVRAATTTQRAAVDKPGAGPASGLSTGSTPPELPVESAINVQSDFRIADLRGKVVVLDFFATWCPPCRTGITELLKLQQQDTDTVRVVGVTRFYGRAMDFAKGDKSPHGGKAVDGLTRDGETAVNSRFASAFGITYPILVTTEKAMRDAYGITEIPTTLVLGKDGKLLGRIVGNGDEEQQKLRALIELAMR